jgi:capsular polysaccharide biosynthesis protein
LVLSWIEDVWKLILAKRKFLVLIMPLIFTLLGEINLIFVIEGMFYILLASFIHLLFF